MLLLHSESNSLMGINRFLFFKKNNEKVLKKLFPSGLTIHRENPQSGKITWQDVFQPQLLRGCHGVTQLHRCGSSSLGRERCWLGSHSSSYERGAHHRSANPSFPPFCWWHQQTSEQHRMAPLSITLTHWRRWLQADTAEGDVLGCHRRICSQIFT